MYFEITLKIVNDAIPLIRPDMAFAGIIPGRSILVTASLGIPLKTGVSHTFNIDIVITITIAPTNKPIIVLLLVFFLLYIMATTAAKERIEKKFMITA